MTRRTGCNLREWSVQDRAEPTVRIGIVLDEDAEQEIRIDLPVQPQTVSSCDEVLRSLADQSVTLGLDGKKLNFLAGDHDMQTSGPIRIEPTTRDCDAAASMTVRNVVAGRGFHWQKRIDVSLSGMVEILVGDGGLILVNELPLEVYLAGVITAEMSGLCPAAFLEAQCVVARSWLLAMSERKHDTDPFDRCNDDCCQRYQGVSNISSAAQLAVNQTKGIVLLDESQNVVDAVYSKCCGGISESAESVWGHTKPCVESIVDAANTSPVQRYLPLTEESFDAFRAAGDHLAPHVYCSPQFIPPQTLARYLGHVDEPGDYYRWTVTHSRRELEAILARKVPQLSNLKTITGLAVEQCGASGRASVVRIEWTDRNDVSRRTCISPEYNIRNAMHADFLYSSAFSIEKTWGKSGMLDTITLRGLGWGHGAGFCQMGGLGMALSGKRRDQILNHYYPSAMQTRAYK
ncbi:MAG: SpoIID/LytB domain-containing protein [Planctomycetes bacterium]|nr:SpoIID/LytB domain-containing protein [Planctomycetota bacterium]